MSAEDDLLAGPVEQIDVAHLAAEHRAACDEIHRLRGGSLNAIAAAQATEVERIWPTPAGQDPVLRQVAALTEEVGEIARAVLKRSHASRSADGTHKGQTVDQWTENLAVEIGQALGVLLGLAHQEGLDLDGQMAWTLDALRNRPSIVAPPAPDPVDPPRKDQPHQ